MQNLKMLKNKMIIMASLSILLLKANGSTNTEGYNPDDVKKFENSNPHTCTQCDLSGWNMHDSKVFVYGGDYSYTNLSGAILDNSDIFDSLSGGSYEDITNLQYSDFSGSTSLIGNAYIGGQGSYRAAADFSNSNFDNVKYNQTTLGGISFRNATFKYAKIINSTIATPDIYGANFYHATLIGTVFSYIKAGGGIDFTGADLSNVTINSTSQISNLVRAIFANANLTNTMMKYCDMDNADFTGAILTGASIINGNLCNAKISPQQLASMTSLSGTVGPDCKTIYK